MIKFFKFFKRKRNKQLQEQPLITSTKATLTELPMSESKLNKNDITPQQALAIKERLFGPGLIDNDEEIIKLFHTGDSFIAQYAIEDMLIYTHSHQSKQLDMWFDNGQMLEFAKNNSASPKQILRSSLFAPVRTGRRKVLEDMAVGDFGDLQLLYSGIQLDQSDNDVLLGLIALLSELKGTPALAKITSEDGRHEYTRITVNTNGFLIKIGKPKGKRSRLWLRQVLIRLSGVLSVMKGEETSMNGAILGKSFFDLESKTFCVDINFDYVRLFADNNHTFIDLKQRALLGKSGFSKWLHGFVSTHQGKSQYSAEKLFEMSGSTHKRMRDFIKLAVSPAFEKLVEIKAVKRFEKKGHLFIWER
jgi:hypothetical protein